MIPKIIYGQFGLGVLGWDNSGKNPDLGSAVVWGAIFTIIFKKRVARKLRRIILLHFGLVTFNIHFPKIRKVLMFMIFGPSERDHDFPNARKYEIMFNTCFFEMSEPWTSNFDFLEKARAEQSWRPVLYILQNLENWINIYIKHEMAMW